MGQDLCAHSKAARAVFDEADTFIGTKLSSLCFYGPEESLRQTFYTQPALFVTSVAALRALQEAGAPGPQAVAGHSVGEYAALFAAGALTFETGLHLVERRAQEMHRAASGASRRDGGCSGPVRAGSVCRVRGGRSERGRTGAGGQFQRRRAGRDFRQSRRRCRARPKLRKQTGRNGSCR